MHALARAHTHTHTNTYIHAHTVNSEAGAEKWVVVVVDAPEVYMYTHTISFFVGLHTAEVYIHTHSLSHKSICIHILST